MGSTTISSMESLKFFGEVEALSERAAGCAVDAVIVSADGARL